MSQRELRVTSSTAADPFWISYPATSTWIDIFLSQCDFEWSSFNFGCSKIMSACSGWIAVASEWMLDVSIWIIYVSKVDSIFSYWMLQILLARTAGRFHNPEGIIWIAKNNRVAVALLCIYARHILEWIAHAFLLRNLGVHMHRFQYNNSHLLHNVLVVIWWLSEIAVLVVVTIATLYLHYMRCLHKTCTSCSFVS